MFKLFLDDIREPPDPTWIVARSYHDGIALVEKAGFPDMVSFDHDLGTEKTGMDFAHYLVDLDLDARAGLDKPAMPDKFTYTIHSANPVGVENIDGLLSRYMSWRNGAG